MKLSNEQKRLLTHTVEKHGMGVVPCPLCRAGGCDFCLGTGFAIRPPSGDCGEPDCPTKLRLEEMAIEGSIGPMVIVLENEKKS